MNLLFKLSNPGIPNPTVTQSDIKNYVASMHKNMAWETVLPFIAPATREYLIPHIGRTFYDLIATKYNEDEENLTLEEIEAVELMKQVVAYGVSLDFAIEMNVRLTDTGPQQTSDQEGTSTSPSQWAHSTKNWNTMRKMDKQLDFLLQYLHEHTNIPEFSTYAISKQYAAEGSDFFRTVDEMNEYLNIEGSRRAFSVIAKYFKKAERRYIAPLLGEDFYNELKDAYFNVAMTEEQSKVITLVQRCVAEYGMVEAIPHLSCVLQNDGIVVVSRMDGFNSRSISNTLFGQAMIERVQQKCEQDATTERRELQSFLLKKADDYPTYLNSDAYPTEDTGLNIYSAGDGAIIL